ncbi:Lipin/Ned1/Smp2-domain-containing protein [Mycotypha africana]|uniref:Lipin/Ned1/Smp2-domain-containing protein n=1 Tax=Mycotypha africana TaxID=64632 RepID=UPI002301CDBA|nr:Lipin/Ned1/Smp2-domain-containing protein [Mycotypha africana]KAI8968547.1 Lipin/Ned1/Smp2-domain-containing protein [Mycotypha africana]
MMEKVEKEDNFEDEEDGDRKKKDFSHIPAELQSPKMIIEEQMDKVVTKIDSQRYGNEKTKESGMKNHIHSLDDGSTLLERVAPEAITTTTIAKERFIVRPLNGDIHSYWMDVTHTLTEIPPNDDNGINNNGGHHSDEHKQEESYHTSTDKESIVLDISGYKTASVNKDDKDAEKQYEQCKNTIESDTADMSSRNKDRMKQTLDDSLKESTMKIVADSPTPDDTPMSTTMKTPSKEAPAESVSVDDLSTNVTAKPEDTSILEEKKKEKEETLMEDVEKAIEKSIEPTAEERKRLEEKINSQNDNETVKLKPGRTYRIEMSLCGFSSFTFDKEANATLFKENQVNYNTFVHNPSILNDHRLVFRYDGHYFAAAKNNPLFTSLLIFKKPLQKDDQLGTGKKDDTGSDNLSDSRDTYSYGRGWRQWLSRSSSANAVPSLEEYNNGVIKPTKDSMESENQPVHHGSAPDSTKRKDDGITYSEQTTFTTTTKTTSVGWSLEHGQEQAGSGPFFQKRKNYAKTLRLTSDQLKQLNLKKGVNTISFSVSSAYQGTATCAAKIFFWDHDIQIVISDIDGTITKSDTMGHLMTMIGKDWTHAGVARLYTDIANNGYHFIYLTSRAIGQADYTRDYLRKVMQDNYQLPDGPVIMSPDRLFTSLHREVIMRKPEMFKMACLRDIQRLFGNCDPFYAGFGNRITDAISYRSVNVPSSRIFTIDAQGDLKLELLLGFKSSYIHLNDMVDQIFAPINKAVREEFNDYNFWKQPMPDIQIPELDEEEPFPPTSPKPTPIKPDPLKSLPKESVVAYQPEPKRGLLRSLTSRSSSSTTSNTTASATAAAKRHRRKKETQTAAAKTSTIKKTPSIATIPIPHYYRPLMSSNSAPDLSSDIKLTASDKSHINENSNLKSDEEDYDEELSSGQVSPTVLSSSPRSLPDDFKHNESESTEFIPQLPSHSRSTSGIMSKVMGGVFSRKSVSTTTANLKSTKEVPKVKENSRKIDERQKDSKKKQEVEESKEKADLEELEDEDDLYNSEIDDLDLDKIPFI